MKDVGLLSVRIQHERHHLSLDDRMNDYHVFFVIAGHVLFVITGYVFFVFLIGFSGARISIRVLGRAGR